MIVIRADANEHIGMGHVMRCMSIAFQLNKLGQDVSFIVSDKSAYQAVKSSGFDCLCLNNHYDDKENEIEILADILTKNNIDVLILDSYEVTEKYMSSMKKYAKLVYIDDMRSFAYPADMVVNYIIGGSKEDYPEQEYIDNNTCFLLGESYTPLRAEFDREAIRINENVRRLLITTGGTDECNMILGLLEKIEQRPEFDRVEKIVIAGKYYDRLDDLLALKNEGNNISVHHDVSDICSLMAQCDIAISASGTTIAELASCGVPTVSFSVADNQVPGAISCEKAGIVIYAGDVRENRSDVIGTIIDQVIHLMQSRIEREKLAARAKAMIDGKGAYRIARKINSLCQKKMSFLDLLLDETLCAGKVKIPKELAISVGGVNTRLPAKRKYELLLRIAHEASDGMLHYRPEEDAIRVASGAQEDAISKSGEDYIVFDDDNSADDGWKTDCYLIGKYSNILKENNVFDDAISQIISDAHEPVRYSETVDFLEKMVAHNELYWHIDGGSSPILIYKGSDVCYDVLNIFAEQLGGALVRQGKQVIYFDTFKRELSELTSYIGKHFQAIIGVQTFAFVIEMLDGAHYLHEHIYGPKYNIVLDHPIWGRKHINKKCADFHVLTHDANYVEFIKRYFGVDAILFPPAGMTLADFGRSTPHGLERTYDLTFVGTAGNWRVQVIEIRKLPRERRFIANRFLLMMRRHPNMTAEKALAEVLLTKYGKILPDDEFADLLYELRHIMYCVMHYYREKVIRTILEAGIRLDVFGDSWEGSPLEIYPNLVSHPNVTVEESLEIFNRSKLSLNIMSWHKGGFTERMANIMLAGAVLVTDYTSYLDGRFCDDDMVIFRLDKLSDLPGRINAMLSDDKLRDRTAASGREKTLAGHTWDKRAEELINRINVFEP